MFSKVLLFTAVVAASGITQEDVHAAQKIWGDALIEIGAHFKNGTDYTSVARTNVGKAYAYGYQQVLFKPTVAHQTESKARHQFRLTLDSAVSYMVGGNAEFPEDLGFALKPWVHARFDNANMILQDMYALAMGDLYLTDSTGAETRVEYSFGYVHDPALNHLRIVLHHSSLPYSPVSAAPKKTDNLNSTICASQ
jgi:hypothetical protein